MSAAKKKPVQVTGPTEGEVISLMGDSYRIVIDGKTTQNEYAVIDMLVPPGGGPGPHAHEDVHESFCIIEGEIEFTTEDGVYSAPAGSTVTIPKGGLVHSFKNRSGNVARMLCMVSPAGMERFFAEVGESGTFGNFVPPPQLNERSKARIERIAEKYGQKLFPPDYLDK